MKNLPEKFLSAYNPKETEEKIYKEWGDSGYFNPDNLPGEKIVKDEKGKEKTFSIILPPPNVTGTLHTGHSLMLVIQDTIARFYRMNGYRTLWLPGTDHAAIATQSVVEKKLQKEEGKSRHDVGREKLLEKIEEFVSISQNTIISQFKSMGASLDWSRLTFTLDEERNFAVNTMFKKMYEDGLIYQGNRIVNWDPKGQTVISDDEIVYEERKAKFYTFKYSKDFPIFISTTRPETKVGDTAVAVNPEDERYKEFVGKEYEVTFCNVQLKIKIIADKEVDMEFGTGALGVTPAHSQIDWDMAERHNLSKKQVINEYAKMINCNEELDGKKTLEAREIIVNWLKENNLLEKEEEISQNVSTAERTGGIIEPLPKLQWFIGVNKEFSHFGKTTTLKKLMLEAVEEKGLKIIPDRFEKVYFHWINNLRDWCISRQIWYGHRIPVWYDESGNVQAVGFNDTGKELMQDEDTLDTWFSSGMWTFSTLGWPEKTKDLETFHPTNLMETGYDLIFFWVARMIMMSTYALNEIPFETTYLHGLVRDAQGRKMSKSLNNALDPRELIEKFGTDALRMSLIIGNGPGNDLKLGEDKVKAYKNFANKIWNATRFVLEKTADYEDSENLLENITFSEDKNILAESMNVIKEITEDIENYRLHLASEKIYAYFWHEFCDKHIETLKVRIMNEEEKTSAQATLLLVLKNLIITLHPFMPFVTEEIWKSIKSEKDGLLLVTKWVK
ncbi:Valine--tRNA ligase [bioreactor metagenome]|uniref:valine--tRNA ligase n=1 Tax=bioreactor metagenome TaxID=1076179 RepID=A0A644T5D6_9ZZZZ|nr:valine--tRNA ligase [Candidatus Elulimicrobiales bacterium]